MTKLDDVIGKMKKEFGNEFIGSLEETKIDYKRIPFRTPSLTYIFRGGMPRTIVELVGEPSSGKSTTCYAIIGEAQRILRKEWEEEVQALQELTKPKKEDKERLQYLLDRGPQKVVYLDHEFTSDPEWMAKNGVDVSQLIYIMPQGESAEKLFDILIELAETGEIGVMIIDSIPAMASDKAKEKGVQGATYGGISGPLTRFCTQILALQKKYGMLIIGVNVPKQDMAGYHRLITSGGNYWKHACSIRLLFKKGDFYDETYGQLKAHPDEAYGNYTEVEVIKNKATKPDRRMCKFSITYDTGVDGFNDYVNMAISLGLLQKAGAWLSIIDENGEVVTHTNGDVMKWQGLAKTINYMKEHEDVFEEVRNKVDELITAA